MKPSDLFKPLRFVCEPPPGYENAKLAIANGILLYPMENLVADR